MIWLMHLHCRDVKAVRVIAVEV